MDYLLRSYTLFRVESAYEIREDLMEAIKYVGARTEPASGEVRMGVDVGFKCQVMGTRGDRKVPYT